MLQVNNLKCIQSFIPNFVMADQGHVPILGFEPLEKVNMISFHYEPFVPHSSHNI